MSRTSFLGSSPRSARALCAQAKPENATALTPWPGKVLSPTQYRESTSVRLKGIPRRPRGLLEGMGP